MGIGAFAGGLASGIVTGTNLARSVARDKREEETAGLQRRILKTQVDDVERRSADDKAVRDAVQAASAPTWQGNGGDQVTNGSQQERMLAQQEGMFAEPGSLANRQTKIADGLNAGWQEALKRGDQANFEKYFGSWVGLRTKLRTEAVNKADAQFRLSNGQDMTGYIKAYNDFVDDGTKIKELKPAPDGSGYQAVIDLNGKEVAQIIPREKMGEMLMTLRDPAAMAKREADMAMERFKASLKTDTVPEGGMAVRNGVVVARNQRERPMRDNFMTRTLPGEHGGQEVVDLRTVGKPGGATGLPEPQPGGPGGMGGKEDRQFYKDHAPVLDDARARIDAALGDRVTDPVTGKLNYAPNEKSRSASAWAAGIYRNAVKRGTPISPDVLTEIVTKGQQTDAKGKPIMAVIEDAATGKLYKAPAIVYQGQSYLTDAEPKELGDDEATAWRNRGKATPKPAAATPAPKPAAKPAAAPKAEAPGLKKPAERAAAEPALVDEPALAQTPAERARAAREQSQQRIENDRKARDDETKKQGARLSAYNFRNLLSRGKYTKADKAAIQSAIDSGMLNERETQTAQSMLEKIGGGGAVAEAR